MIAEKPVNDELTISRYFTGKPFYEGDGNLPKLLVHDPIYIFIQSAVRF